ncbi:MAG: hypothetical protein V4544_06495 [Pseudomonadota bacterium]
MRDIQNILQVEMAAGVLFGVSSILGVAGSPFGHPELGVIIPYILLKCFSAMGSVSD